MPSWHAVVIAIFAVGVTVYLISHNNENAGWVYVLILLLGMAAAMKNFGSELSGLFGNTRLPSRAPGTTTGPF